LLNHHYTSKNIVFSVDKKSWNKTHSIFEKRLKQKGISKKHMLQLSDVLDNNHEVILSLCDDKQQQQQEKDNDKDKQKHKRRYATYKYSAKGSDILHEAIILAGQPIFLIYDKDNNEIKAVPIVKEATRMLKPPSPEEYPYEPYEFANIDELQLYMDRATNESIDSLYQNAKSIVRKYNDQDEHKLTLLAADIIWSYFQDKFSTTHYIAIVGGNGSGKSTIGDTFAAIGYRTVTMTDPSAANIFRVLGRIEYGQCTIVMDEAEKIDKSPDTMNVLKSGYQFNARISKINMNEEVQQWFYPYCLKFIIAERSPSQMQKAY
jgi:ABC-type glutathione transport system ATPase component